MARVSVGAVGFVLLLLAQPAAAQEVDDATRASARQLGYAGVEAFQAKDYAAANEKLGRAFRVLQVPSLGLWSARALVKLGKFVEAQERYVKVRGLPVGGGDAEIQRKAQNDAASELSQLSLRVPSVVIQLEGAAAADVDLTIDGSKVASDLAGEPRPVNPGTHLVVGKRGAEQVQATVTVAESEHPSLVLRFKLAAPRVAPALPPSQSPLASSTPPEPGGNAGSAQRTAGWVTIGVGGAALLVGGISGGIALGKGHDLSSNSRCQDYACGPSQQSSVDAYNSMRTVSTIGFIAGGVIAAGGAVLLLTAPSKASPASASLWLGPGSAGLKGAF